MVDDDSSEVLKQWARDRYCVPEGMNLVMISNGKSDDDVLVINALVLYARFHTRDATANRTIVLSDEAKVCSLVCTAAGHEVMFSLDIVLVSEAYQIMWL